MCGDWNTSFERDTCQTRFMTAFMERNDLRLSWHHPMANKSNTYVNHNLHMNRVSTTSWYLAMSMVTYVNTTLMTRH